MAPKREGPFKVEEVLGPVTYRLKLLTNWKIHNMFHAVLLKPYIETEVHGGNFSRPILNILDGEEVYNVETILKHWRRGWSYQYLIKWGKYLISEALWEPETAFSNDGDLLSLYKKQHQLWNVASCETFWRTKKSTQPALPTLPEKRVSDIEVLSKQSTKSLLSLTNLHVSTLIKAPS
jgi:hypothetical protein